MVPILLKIFSGLRVEISDESYQIRFLFLEMREFKEQVGSFKQVLRIFRARFVRSILQCCRRWFRRGVRHDILR